MKTFTDVTVNLKPIEGPAQAYAYLIRCEHTWLCHGTVTATEPGQALADVKLAVLRQFGHLMAHGSQRLNCACMEQASMRHGLEHRADPERIAQLYSPN